MGQPLFRNIMVFEDANLMPTPGEPKILLMQPIFNFIVPFLPTQLSFSILTAVSHFEFDHKYDLEVQVVNDKTGEKIYSGMWEINQPEDQAAVPPSAVMISNVKNMIVDNEGVYRIQLMIHGEKLGEQYFEVFDKRKSETK